MILSHWLERHRAVVLVVFGVLVAAGIGAFRALPVGLFPRAPFPRVVVSIEAGDRPAERMVADVTRPIEVAIRTVPGVRTIRSNSSRGSSDISVNFDWSSDMVAARLEVESAVARSLPNLPPDVHFDVRRMDPTVFPVMGLSLSNGPDGHRSPVELRDLGLYELAPLLSSIEGVANIEVIGGRSEELQVQADPERLEAVDLTLDDLKRAVAAANVVQAVGRLEDREKLALVVSNNEIQGTKDLSRLIVRRGSGVVRLGDVATVSDSTAPEWSRVTASGTDAVLVDVLQQPDGNLVELAQEVRARVAEFSARVGSDVRVGVWYDQSELVVGSEHSVIEAIWIGGLLAAVILLLFLGDWRVTLVASIAAPVVLASSLFVLYACGMTLNIMTLGGLAASVGLIVDDAIVMVEHILRRRRDSATPQDLGIAQLASEMAGPLTASSLVTIVVHLPLAFLTGVSGAFFKPLSATAVVALVLSWLCSLLFVPTLTYWVIGRGREGRQSAGPLYRKFVDRYESMLGGMIARPVWLALPVVFLLAAGGIGFWRLGSGFMPAFDEGGFVLDYLAPPGTSLAETDRQLRKIETILTDTPEVAEYSRRTGLQLGGFVTESNEGDFFVRLKPYPRRGVEEVIDDVRGQIEKGFPSFQIELPQLIEDLIADLTAVPEPVEVKLFGEDPKQLRETAEIVAKALEKVPGLVDIADGVVLAGDSLQVKVDREKAELLEIDPQEVTSLLTSAVEGEVATSLQRQEKLVGIRVWTPPEARDRIERLGRLRVRGRSGQTVSLGHIASIEQTVGEPQLTRENLKPLVSVTALISGRDLGSAMRDVKAAVTRLRLPGSIEVEYGGLYGEQQKSFRNLTLVLGAAVTLVLIVLLYVFGDVAVPLVILGTTLVAATGAFTGLWLTDCELNVSSMMGLTMLVGISAEAAVLYTTQWKESRRHLELVPALIEAGRLRLRPILMTGFAAILSLAPLSLGLGNGGAMLQPLAIAIVSGLVATLPAVLVVLPVLIYCVERRRA